MGMMGRPMMKCVPPIFVSPFSPPPKSLPPSASKLTSFLFTPFSPGMGAVNPAFQQNAMMGMNAMGGGASPSGAAGGAGGVSGNGAVGGAAAGGGASPNTGTGTVRPQMNPMMGMGMGGCVEVWFLVLRLLD